MAQYKIIALSVAGRKHRIYKAGEIIDESGFNHSVIPSLIKHKFIEEYNEAPIDPLEPQPRIGPFKIAICTAVWKRPEIFKMFAEGFKKLGAGIELIVAGSEGNISRELVLSCAPEAHYIEIPNDPLATKMNATTLKARDLGADYVICVGSDDIITPELLKVYIEYMRQGFDYIAVLDWYFYDTVTKKAAYWGGYIDGRKGHTCGAGRVLSSELMAKWNWQPWEIKDSKVLDNSMQNKLKRTAHSAVTFSLKEKGVFAIDVKSSTNMTPFALWPNTKYIDVKQIKKHFPYVCAE